MSAGASPPHGGPRKSNPWSPPTAEAPDLPMPHPRQTRILETPPTQKQLLPLSRMSKVPSSPLCPSLLAQAPGHGTWHSEMPVDMTPVTPMAMGSHPVPHPAPGGRGPFPALHTSHVERRAVLGVTGCPAGRAQGGLTRRACARRACAPKQRGLLRQLPSVPVPAPTPEAERRSSRETGHAGVTQGHPRPLKGPVTGAPSGAVGAGRGLSLPESKETAEEKQVLGPQPPPGRQPEGRTVATRRHPRAGGVAWGRPCGRQPGSSSAG